MSKETMTNAAKEARRGRVRRAITKIRDLINTYHGFDNQWFCEGIAGIKAATMDEVFEYAKESGRVKQDTRDVVRILGTCSECGNEALPSATIFVWSRYRVHPMCPDCYGKCRHDLHDKNG